MSSPQFETRSKFLVVLLTHSIIPGKNMEAPKRCKKKANNTESDDVSWSLCKRYCGQDHTSSLPDEILIKIFSLVCHEELYRTVRCVCKRWYVLVSSPQLWKNIYVKDEDLPSQILFKWIEHSPLLQELTIKDRRDADMVTEKVSKYCSQLRSLRIENTWQNETLGGANLCRLLTKCKRLNNLHFSGVKIRSCKFFKLLSFRKHYGATKCSYYGPINQKQMKALLESIINSPNYEAATLFTSNNKKIPIKMSPDEDGERSGECISFENIWQDITNDDVIRVQNPENRRLREAGDNAD